MKVALAVIGFVLLVAGIVIGLKTCNQPDTIATQIPVTDTKKIYDADAKETPIPVETQQIINYNSQENDETLQTRLKKRKTDYGLDKGVNIIVKPEESIKIGDSIIPMQEILDKIRLKKGDIIEKNLPEASVSDSGKIEKGRMLKKMDALEERFAALEKKIEDPSSDGNDEAYLKAVKEHDDLKKTVLAYGIYKQLNNEIDRLHGEIKAGTTDSEQTLLDRLADLKMQQETFENELINRILPDEKPEAYGVYVVQSLDNIWNIHFKFLKEYFNHRGISLAPISDEPNEKGISSGIGRILKFSENMVYIYNFREHKLDVDLNLIQPLSKIVIFNMGQVFSTLEQIDYTNVNRVQFDGENLWIPAEQQ